MADTRQSGESSATVFLRRYPYPYRAMLAICSDLDETADLETYLSIAQFLNTADETRHGAGVDLEVGNTLYFDMPNGDFSYWNTTEDGRDRLRKLIQTGHIDCFHSFGDIANSRDHAKRCLDELEAHGCRLPVWVDHAIAPSNFGADIMLGHGDIPEDDCYHADLTVGHGVRYVWVGRVTSVIGQDATYRPLGVWRWRAPVKSGVTAVKDIVKRLLSARKGGKYGLHSGNRLLRETSLRDGQRVIEFMRCNPNPGGISVGDHSEGIAEALAQAVLEALVACKGTSIIYTHLGKRLDHNGAFSPETVSAFQGLARFSEQKKILVATTYRLLNYKEAVDAAVISVMGSGSERVIDVAIPEHCDPLGLTFYADDETPSVRVNGIPVADLVSNPPDETGRRSYSIPWPQLQWGL